MSRVLITGAGGFLGRHCLPLLVARGHEVHALSRRRSGGASPDVSWHELDLLTPGCPAAVVRRVQPDRLLHLAWCAEPGTFWESQENTAWVRASIEMMLAFKESGGGRFVGAGSCAEYDPTAGECREDCTPLRPGTLYGTCKQAFGSILLSASRQSTPSSAWGRIFFMYGPHEHPSRIVSYAVRSLLRGEPAECSDGRDLLDFLHVADVAAAFVALLESEVRGPVNIGSGHPVSVREILEEIGRQVGRLELIRFGARELRAKAYRLWANTERLTKEVGWTPQYDLASGMQQTIEWCRNSPGESR